MTKYYTHEEMLDTVVGEKGTATRDEFEAKLKAEVDAYKIGLAIQPQGWHQKPLVNKSS